MLSANQIEEIKEQAFIGVPSNFQNICKVYPFKIREILEMGSTIYYRYLGLLLLTEADIMNLVKEKTGEEYTVENISPIVYLLQSAANNDQFFLEIQTAVSTFVKEEVILLPKINSILIGSPQEKRLINENNFSDFQSILRIQNRKKIETTPPENETAGQRKMRLLREKVAEVKAKQAKKNGGDQTFLDMLEIATVFGIDINNCTLYAFYSLLKRYQMKEKWTQDISMICAGADSKKIDMKYWGEHISDNEGG